MQSPYYICQQFLQVIRTMVVSALTSIYTRVPIKVDVDVAVFLWY